MATTYEKIASTTLSSAVASTTFSSISGAYTDLVLVINGKTTGSGGYNALAFTVNGDTASNYSRTGMYGVNGSEASFQSSGINSGYATIGQAADNFGNAVINFQNYSNTTTNKTFLSQDNYSRYVVYGTITLWRNTSAITSITLSGTGGYNIASGSTFNLYGILKAA